MLIITGKLYVATEERQKWIDAHYEIVKGARSMPGCVDLYLVADPVEAGRVNLFEQWQSEDDLQAWRRVADPPPRPPTLGGSVEKHQLGRSGPPF